MPKNSKQALGIFVVGGLAFLTGSIASNATNQQSGISGFAVSTLGGAVGAGLGLLVLNGSGVRFA